MYPLKFQPIYKEKLWGGAHLKQLFNRPLPSDHVGESWEICCRQKDINVVSNGSYKGYTLKELTDSYPDAILGKGSRYREQFPLLFKIIDANDNLSVQVHPDDAYARQQEGDNGKTEAWYVISAKEDAGIIYGLNPGVSKEQLKEAVKAGSVDGLFRLVPVKAGDLIYIPSKTVHALMEGTVIYEVQQNSDVTYRLYDYDRVDEKGEKRALHIERALDVIDFEFHAETDFRKQSISCPFFNIEKLCLRGDHQDNTEDRFTVYCILEGEGELSYRQGVEKISSGDSILLPASLGKIRLSGNLKLLRVTA